MSIYHSIKDHIMIGGPNAIAGWGLLVLLVLSGGVQYLHFIPGVNVSLFLLVLFAAAMTGNGVYAINAYYDVNADRINKPNRPLPSGRMVKEHALKYAYTLMATGLTIAVAVSILQSNYMMVVLWSLFTVLGILYSTPPFKLKSRHIFGNICFGAFAGLSYFIGMIFSGSAALASFPILFQVYFIALMIIFVGGVVTMKDFQDYEGDKKNGDITMPVKFGRKLAALIAVVMMVPYAARIPIIPYGTYYQPPIYDFFLRNMGNWVLMAGFIVYILLETRYKDHIVSDAYSRWMYYFMIIYTAYGYAKNTILPQSIATSPFITVLGMDAYIALVIYIVLAIAIILQTRRTGRDILKQSIPKQPP